MVEYSGCCLSRSRLAAPENRWKTGRMAKRKPKRSNRGQFKRGQSGNAGGRPAGLSAFRLACRAHTPAALNTLVTIMANKKASATARVRAVSELLDRGWGKPVQELQVEGMMQSFEVPTPAWKDLTREQQVDVGRRLVFLLGRAAHTAEQHSAQAGA